MKGDYSTGIVIGVIIGVIIIGILTAILDPIRDSYKQGQVDALTGQIKFELVSNPDSSKTWERIKE